MHKTRLLALTIARFATAVTLIAFSIQQFIYVGFRPVVLPYWPASLPGFRYAVYGCSVLMIAAAIWLLFTRDVRQVASLLGTAVLVLAIAGHLPYQLTHNLQQLGSWTDTSKIFAFSGSAFILAGAYAPVPGSGKWLWGLPERLIPLGPVLFSVVLIFCGIEHFVYTDFVAAIIPAYIPWHVFWTYFGGVILIGAGVAIATRVQLGLVATLMGITLFLWVLMLHIPRAIADPHSGQGNEWTSVFEASCFSAIAFVLAVTAKRSSSAL
jgi:uncharacterized membrane protein